MSDYRKRIYEKYVTIQTQAQNDWDVHAYRLWASGTNRRFGDWLPADKTVSFLDVACGPGNFLFFLQEAGYTNLTGIDISPEQLEQAKRICPSARLYLGDLQDFLKEHPNEFDAISGLDIIEHFNKSEILDLLENIYCALKPGGTLLLQTPNAASPFFGNVGYGDFTHEWFFTPDALRRMLNLTGFDNFEARESGPYPSGFLRTIRYFLWRGVVWFCKLYDLIETGSAARIYSRVFVARASRR
jgi:SAM-dependent methyltransferase